MTRYKRRATRNETMQELVAEVRALRADVAMLRAERVQIVPMPYPQPYLQPYPVYPQPNLLNPYYKPYYGTVTSGTSGSLTIEGGVSDTTNVIAYQSGD
jgi:hypothetical protein